VTEHCGGVGPLLKRKKRCPKCSPQKEGWWWYIWTSWHLIRELLGMSSLKEGAEEVAGK
jgi:hypothetical protein